MQKTSLATFGGGCFWCLDAVFTNFKGVSQVVSGYTGGHVKNPTYEQICTGTTNHAEVVQLTFDETIISYAKLLDIFFYLHDPTTLNRQGNDYGTQYRSATFYQNLIQKEEIEKKIKELNDKKVFGSKIVTEVAELKEFYAAEQYHQNYYSLNKDKNPYCSSVISPKVKKVMQKYQSQLK